MQLDGNVQVQIIIVVELMGPKNNCLTCNAQENSIEMKVLALILADFTFDFHKNVIRVCVFHLHIYGSHDPEQNLHRHT